MWRDIVADDGRSEAALGAEAESLQRKVPTGFSNTSLQYIDGFHLRSLCRDQSQNHKLILRHVFQWLKGAGARIVVFQQYSLCFELVKKLAADRFIASLRQPPTALVAASDVKSKSHIGKSGYDRVVKLDAERKPLIEAPAELLVEDARLRV